MSVQSGPQGLIECASDGRIDLYAILIMHDEVEAICVGHQPDGDALVWNQYWIACYGYRRHYGCGHTHLLTRFVVSQARRARAACALCINYSPPAVCLAP